MADKIDYNAINFKNKDVDKFANKFGKGDPSPSTRVRVYTVDNTKDDKKNFKEFVRTSSADSETSSLTVSNGKKDKNYFLSTDKSGSSLSTTKGGKEKITTGPAAERKFSRAVRKNT